MLIVNMTLNAAFRTIFIGLAGLDGTATKSGTEGWGMRDFSRFLARVLLTAAGAAMLCVALAAASARAQESVQESVQDSVPESAQESVAQESVQETVKENVQENVKDSAQITTQPPSEAASSQATSQVTSQVPGEVTTQTGTQDVAQACPGNPNALGTSRVLAIDPAEHPRIGRMQYPDSLPLADKEVVLTFDDGPLPPYSNQILDILAAECVKATYFLVGSMARAYPATVRRIFLAGHAIGTHSEHHPFHFGVLPIDRMRHEIDDGIADVSAALGDPRGVAPFFRIPGLDRSNLLESELAARSIAVFSSDTVADDWHHRIKADQIVALALKRLEARGKGILLLHDIHATTVAALPGLLKQLKDGGFRIVQVVPASSAQIEIAARPKAWMLASAMPEQLMMDESAAPPIWPQSIERPIGDDVALPAPDASTFEPDAGLNVETGAVQWPDRPALRTLASEPDPAPRARRSNARAERHHHAQKTRPVETERARHDHIRANRNAKAPAAGRGQRTDLMSKVKSVAALFTPAQPAH
jgi:peptidoglycan/xylan/chitin deacetylase (PgdA/CDA1 family)